MCTFNYMAMTIEEKRVFWILIAILIFSLAIYGIYFYFKNKKKFKI